MKISRLLCGFLFTAIIAGAQTPPTITSQPSSALSGASGWTNVNLTVAATSNAGGSLSYQWQRNGVNLTNGSVTTDVGGIPITTIISGATGTTLSITNFLTANNGTYTAIVTDSAAPGNPAVTNGTVITVTDTPPSVANQSPTTITVTPGGRARFYANINGSRPLNIQWSRNGVPIPGFNGSSFTSFELDKVSAAEAGVYTATISNAYGSTAVSPITLALAAQPDPLDRWHWENPDPQGNNLTAMTSANGRLVVVGRGGTVITTTNGEDAYISTTGNGNSLAAVTYDAASQLFYAAGGFSTILSSPDARTWTNRSLTGVDDGYTGVAADGAGTVIVVGSDFYVRPTRALIRRSVSGGAWTLPESTPANFPSVAFLNGVAYGVPSTGGAGRFVSVGTNGNGFVSTDAGRNWTAATTNTTVNLNAIAFGNGRFVAVGSGGTIRVSTDGQSFTSVTSGTAQNLTGVGYLTASSTWVALGTPPNTTTPTVVVTSTDQGATWTAASLTGIVTGLNAVAANENLTVIAGANGRLMGMATSPTFSVGEIGPFSESVHSLYTDFFNHVDWDAATNQFIALASNGNIFTGSRDGTDWLRRSQPSVTNGFLTDWVRFGSRLIVTGSAGTLYTSDDGAQSWSMIGGLGSSQFQSVAASPARVVAVGANGTIYTSTDGAAWTAATSGVTTLLRRVGYANGRFVAVGGNDAGGTSITILTSDDGLAWTPRTAGTTGQLWGVAHADGVWTAVGSANLNGGGAFILRSTDNGVTWTRQELPGLTFAWTIRHLAGRWMVVGSPNSIAVSTDGLTWDYKAIPAQPAVNTMRGIAASPDAFVVVGNDATILSSAPRAPVVTSLSAPAMVASSGTAQLFVNATSAYPLSFQWRLNGQPIANATASVYTVTEFTSAQAGSYDVVVTANRFSEDDGRTSTASVTSGSVPVTLAPAAGVSAVDPGFTRPQFLRHSLPGRITAAADGSVYATFTNGRTLNTVDGLPVGAVIKLNAQGQLDRTFNPGPALADAWAVVPLNDGTGRILVGGVAADEGFETGLTLYRVFRLNADGSRDWSYNSPVFTGIIRYMTLQPDGKLLVTPSTGSFTNNGGLSNLVRLNADGSRDFSFVIPSFNTINPIFANIVVDAQSRILIGGTFGAVNGVARPGVARLNPDGSLDAGFVPSGYTFAGQVRGLGVQTQGANADKVLVAGGTLTVNGVSRPVIRLNTDGSLDSSFTLAGDDATGTNPAFGTRVRLLNMMPNDQFTVVSTKLTRFNADGTVDTSFVAPVFNQEAFWIDTLADGRVYLPPEFGATANGTALAGPVRFAATGVLDSTFAPGRFSTLVYPSSIQIQPDGRILAFGNFDAVGATATPRAGVARFTASGALETFALAGLGDLYSVGSASVLSDGRILASVLRGSYQTNLTSSLHRFNADGTLDAGFALAAGAISANVRVLPDNRILAWSLGAADLLNNRSVVQRLTVDGAIDAGFTGLGTASFGQVYRNASNVITEIVLGQFRVVGHYPDGRALVVATLPGSSTYVAGATGLPVTLLRLNLDGTIDTGFNVAPIQWSTTLGVTAVTLDPARGVSAQWTLRQVGGSPFSGVVPQADGGVIVYGAFKSLAGVSLPGIARLTNTGELDTSFSVGSGPELRRLSYRNPLVQSVAVAPDGKIWVAGVFDTFAGVAAPGLVRLNANGTVDPAFASDVAYRQYLGGGVGIEFGPGGEVVLAGGFGSATGFPSGLNRLVAQVAPTIVTQPVGVTGQAGGTATFSVGVQSGLQAAYQWFRNGTAIAGATSSTLRLTNLQASDLGDYTVRVTTAQGQVTSNPATLASSSPAPVVLDQPAGATVVNGGRLLLRVGVNTSVTYQWMKDGQDIPRANAADFEISSVTANDAGGYSVRVTGFGGTATSAPAFVTVVPADPVLWQAFSEAGTENSPARVLSDGAGKLYFPWTVSALIPDMVRGRLAGALTRLNEADGTLDTGFRVDPAIAAVRHIARQTDGRIIAGVSIGDVHRVVRLNANGSTDASFNSPLFARGVRFVTLQTDGKVLVAATDNLQLNPPANALALAASTIYRLQSDGSLDASFTPVVLNAPTGNIFGPPVVDLQGRIYLCGGFTSVNGTPRQNFARLNADGTLDALYGNNVPAGFNSTQGRGVVLQSDGRAVFFGDFRSTARGTTADAIMAVRFNTDGTFDSTFAQPLRSQLGFGAGLRLRWLEVLPDDRMVAVSNRLVRLTANGALDASFTASTFTRETFWLAVGLNGQIYVPDLAGVNGAASVLPVWHNGLAVFSASGAPVTAFQIGGWGRSTRTSNGVVLPDGRVWIGGVFNRYGSTPLPGLAQFTSSGQLTGSQATFPAGAPLGARLQPFSTIASAGGDRVFAAFMNAANTVSSAYQTLQRLNADGTVDPSFVPELPAGYGLGGSTTLHASPGGKLVLSQSSVSAGAALAGNAGSALLRLSADGSRDDGFNPNLSSFAIVERGANNTVTAIRTGGLTVNQILPDGRILVTIAAVDGNLRLQRLLSTGELDASFTPPSFGSVNISSGFTTVTFDPVTNTSAQWPISTSTASGIISAVRQMADGRVYVAATLAGQPKGLLRLRPDGTLDPTFNPGGAGIAHTGVDAPAIVSLEQDAAGRIYLAGRFASYNGTPVPGLCRLHPDGTLDSAWNPGLRIAENPTVTVQLRIVGDQLYLFGSSAGTATDPLPTPFRVVSLAEPSSSGITAQPLAQSLVPGQSLQLFVGVAGPGPYTYQWRRNGVNLPGATSSTFVIPSPIAADGGSYDVVVTASGGQTFTSTAATIDTTGLLATLTGIGDLPGGAALSQVRDATRVGGTLVAVGTASANPDSPVFDTSVLWASDQGLVALPNLVANTTATSFITASAVTHDGAYIASRARANTGSLRHAVRVTRNGLTNLNLGGLGGVSGFSAANAISEDGAVLYGFATNPNGVNQAVRFEVAGPSMTFLPAAAAELTESSVAGRGIASNGAVAVGTTSNPTQTNFAWAVPGNRAFRYTHANTTTALLPLLAGGTWNGALAVTSDGNQTLLAADSQFASRGELAIHNAVNGQIRRLGTPNSAWGPANFGGITADGAVAVTYFSNLTSGSSYAYFRNAYGWFHLHSALAAGGVNLADWKLDGALGVSPDGRLVFGSGLHRGVTEGFVAELPAGFLANFNALPRSAAGQAIVGTWRVNDAVLLFLPEGIYYHMETASAADIAQGAQPGFERGTYTWNPASGELRIVTLTDTNGDIGLSDANGRNDITVRISGDVATATIPGEGDIQFTRVLGAPGTLTGGWVVGDPTVADQSSAVVFFADGTYLLADDGPQDDSSGRDGLESGTFTWNASTGALTVRTTADYNGEWGLSHNAGSPTIELQGIDRAVFRDAEGSTQVSRVGPAASTGPSILDQPVARRLSAGSNVQLVVGATGAAPLSYVWYRNGVALESAGPQGATLYLNNVALSESGVSYSVRVTDANGSILSRAATLTVLPVDDVLWQQFTEYSGENSPARIVPDGAGKLYLPWNVTAQIPDFVAGKAQGALVRLNEIDGSLDPTFRVDRRIASVTHVALQPDGRVVAAAAVGDVSKVLRLHADGATDTSFTAPLFGRGVRFVTRQADGRILVAATDNVRTGAPAGALGVAAPTLYRLNSDGSLDGSFTPVVFNATGNLFGPPVLDAQGRIYLAGVFNSVSGTARFNVARLNPDGTVDPAYAAALPAGWVSTQGRGVALQSDGRAVFVGDFRYTGRGSGADPLMAVRFNVDGSFDTTFAQPLRSQLGFNPQLGTRMRYLVMLPDDSFVGVSDRLVRLHPNGERDTDFVTRVFDRETFWVARGANGRFYVPDFGGVAGQVVQQPLWGNGIGSFEPNGTPAFSFQTGGWGRVMHTANGVALTDGRVWMGGNFNRYGSRQVPGIAQFNANGQINATEPSFRGNPSAAQSSLPSSIIGEALNDQIYLSWNLAFLDRVNPDGSRDSAFTPQLPGGYVLTGAALHHAGGNKLLLAKSSISAQDAINGTASQSLLRLNADGSVDTGFTPAVSAFAAVERDANNTITMIRTGGLTVNEVRADGSILLTAAAVNGNLSLMRLLQNGTADPAFTPPSFGSVTSSTGFTTAGTQDPVTGTNGQFPITTYLSGNVIRAAVTAPDGRIYVGGSFALAGKPTGLVRLQANGTFDDTFNNAGAGIGLSTADSAPAVNALAIDAAGRLYVAGRFDSYNGTPVFGLFRLNADGTRDQTWSPGFNVFERPFVNVRLQVSGTKLYVFGAAGNVNDLLPTPFRVAEIGAQPVITSQPQSQTPVLGGTLTLRVTTESGTFTYQWFRDGVLLPGATSSTYTVPNVTAAANGSYTVVVTGSGGSVTSAAATVAVNTNVAPVIVDAPFPRRALPGDEVVLRVGALSGSSLTYQWSRDNQALAGATAAELRDTLSTTGNRTYAVALNNASGSVTSPAATVMVPMPSAVLAQRFTEFSTEQAPARVIHDGAGKLYLPWSVQDRSPDMGWGQFRGALMRFDEATGAMDSFQLDRRYRRVMHVAPMANGQALVAVGVGDTTTVIRVGTTGAVDPSFAAPSFARSVRFITLQPDGKVLVAATDNLSTNAPAGSLAVDAPTLYRLNANGSLDNTFAPAVLNPLSFNPSANLFGPPVLDAQGRIYLVGAFGGISGTARQNVARLNANGTVDSGFAATLPAGWISVQGRGVALQSDGRAIFVGDFRYTGRGSGADPIMAVRFNTDGSFDTTFAQPLRSQLGFNPQLGARMRYFVVLADDSIVGVSDRLVKLTPNGSPDATFVTRVFDREAFWLARGGNGRFYVPDVGAVMGAVVQQPLFANGVASFSADGTPDFGFQTGGFGRAQYPTSARVLADGSVWLAGGFNRYGAAVLPAIARFTAPGTLSGALFAVPASAPAHARAQPFATVAPAAGDQSYVIWSQASNVNGAFYATLLRVNADGTPDNSFAPQLPANYNLGTAQPLAAGNGRLLLAQGTVAAQVALAGGAGESLLRLNADGSRDTAYTPNLSSFAVVERDANNAVTLIRTGGLNVAQVLSDGRALIVVSAVDGNLRLQRLNADGTLDVTFNAPSFGTITPFNGFTSVLTDPVSGATQQFALSTYSASDLVRTAVQMPDGRIYVGGRFQLGGVPRGLVRLNANGSLDTTFTGSGIAAGTTDAQPYVSALAVDAAGRLYAAGRFTTFNGQTLATPGLLRLNADGSRDTAWNPGFGIRDVPVATANLVVANDQLYVFGTPGNAGDVLPATYRVTGASVAPVIVTPPASAAVAENTGLTLFVNASSGGLGALSYQWYRNGTAIAGATGSGYSLMVNAETAGTYHVVVSSAFGSTTSAPAVVSFTPSAPTFGEFGNISTSFGSQVLPAGSNAALQVLPVVGTRPMTFQWKFNGEDIPGATGEQLFLQDWQPADAGAYSVTATNALGTVTTPADAIYVTPEAGWRWRNPFPAGNWLTRVSFVNGQFFVGGLRGTLLVSSDGLTWETRHVPAVNNLFGFRYVNGQYIALGSLNLIITSTDGRIWTSRDTGLDGSVTQLQDMTYGGGRYVAVGTGGITARSVDGHTWTPGSIGQGVTETIIGLIYTLNKFHAIGTDTGRIYSSADGETWTWSATPATSLRNLAYGAGRLVAVGAGGVIVTSTNGTTWTNANSGTTQNLVGIDFVNGRFVATGANGTILTSFDGNLWTARNSAGNQSVLQSAAFGNGRYIVVGQQGNTGRAMLGSADSVTWTSQITGPRHGTNLLGVASSGSTVVAVGAAGAIVSSSDLATWTERASGTTQALNDVTYANGRFLAVGNGGTVLSSTDGSAWTNVAPTGLNGVNLGGIRHDGAQWVAVGGGSAYTSTDGIAWTARATGANGPLQKLVIGGGRYVAVGVFGHIVESTNGTEWTVRTAADPLFQSNTAASLFRDVAYGNGRFVAVAGSGTVRVSTNGTEWTPVRFTYGNLSSVNFIAGQFIATANGHQYFTSTDGLTWTGRFTGSAEPLNDTVLHGEQVVGVGNFGTIMTAGAPVLAGPQSQTANAGSRVVLKSVVSESAFPVDYVWTHNGNVIEGVDSPILVIPSATAADAGDYVVTAVNPLGSATSTPATLTLNVGVAITAQPQPRTVVVGGSAEFSVTATGIPAPSYQWRRNGLDLPGATAPNLRLANLTLADAGQISVVVRNAAGSVTSHSVALTVNPIAPLITSPSAVTAFVNAPFSYQITTNQTLAAFVASPIPPGLVFTAASGTFSGVPIQPGVYDITLTASNVSGQDQRVLRLTVQPPPPVITSAASSGGRVGQPFSYTIAATNAPTAYAAVGLPPGLTLAGNVISGTPTLAGFYTALLTAQNATGSNSAVLSLSILAPLNAPVFTGSPSVAATAGTALNYVPSFGPGVTNYVLVNLPDGSPSVLPAGLSLNASTGAITGTTAEIGTFPLAIRATNADGSATAVVTLTLNPAPTAPRFTSATSVVATVGAPFAFTLTTTPAAASFAASGLPDGLALDSATGVITGTPSAPGISVVGVAATNGAGLSVGTLTLTVNASPNAPVITSSPIVLGRAGTALSGVQVTATNAPTGFTVVNGRLPDGLALDPVTGALTGTPTSAGETRVWVAGSNGSGRGPALELIFLVERALNVPVVTSNGTASGQVGRAFLYQTIATNAPTSFAATLLPGGLTFDPVTGLISGIPTTETAAPFNVLLTAANADGTSAPKLLAISIVAPPATPRITSATTAGGRVGSPFTYAITASESPTSFAATGLPDGLTFDSQTGVITGTPAVAGEFPVVLRAANQAGQGPATTVTFTVASAPTAPAITSAPDASGKVGVFFSYQIAATGSPTSFAVAGTLPDGLSLNTSTGLISGNPADDPRLYSVTVSASNAAGASQPQPLLISIAPADNAPVITSPVSAPAIVGAPFSYRITATHVPATTPFPPSVFLDAIGLPAGLAVNPSTGLITGTPSQVGTYAVSLVGVNEAGTGLPRTLTLTVSPAPDAPVITGATAVSAQVGVPFAHTITATNAPTSFEALGAPPWLLVNTATGALAGTPTTPGPVVVQLRAANAGGESNLAPLTIQVAAAANTPVVTSARSMPGQVGVAFSYTIEATLAPTSYFASGLPAGLALDAATGQITGTPAVSGTFLVTISATNAQGEGQPVTLTLTIAASYQIGG